MKARKSVEVDVPELSDLPLDPETATRIDELCRTARVLTAQIAGLQKAKDAVMDDGEGGGLKPLVKSLGLPERVLGAEWDLRRTVRVSEKVNEDRLRMTLLQIGISFRIGCLPTVNVDDGNGGLVSVTCPKCSGTGFVVFEGLPAVTYLLEQCTDRSESESWSVYERKVEKEGS